MLRKSIVLSLMLFIFAIITSACGSGGSSGSCEFTGYPNTLGKITLSKYSFNIGVGYKDKVIVYVDGKDKTNEAVFSLISEQTETNSKNIIANIDKGTITALKAGKTKINVHVDNTEADVTFDVNVNNLPNLEVTKNEFSITLGDNSEAQQIIVTLNGKDRTDEAIFTSSDESVATVDENGNITFVGEGTATITVHVEGANDIELKVNVYDPANHRINFKTNNMYETEDGFVMYEGETGNITVIIKGKDRTNEGTYTSGDDNVVTVDNENIHGKIYALNQGNTSINIHVPDTEEDKVVNVIVKPKPQLEEDTFNILLGNTPQIKVNLNGEAVNCSFESDNNDIATVDSTGKITATGIGNTTVYANYDDGIKVHKLPVTVTTTKTVTNDQGVSSTILTNSEKETMIKRLMDTGMISNENDVEDIVVIDESDLDQIIITIDRKDGQKVAVICYQDGTIKYIDTEEVSGGTVTINVANSEKNIFAKENASGEMETVVVPGFYNANNKLLASWELVTGDKIEGGALVFDSNGNKQTVTTSKNVNGVTETVWGWDYTKSYNYWDSFTSFSQHLSNIANRKTTLQNATKLVIPDGVKTIGNYAFASAKTPLNTVVYPNSFTNISQIPFYYKLNSLKITNFTINSTNPNYDSIDGIIYDENHETCLACPMDKNNVIVPEGVRIINSAFSYNISRSVGPYDSNADIKLPNTIKIFYNGFYNMSNLKWIEFPNGVEYLGEGTSLLNQCSSINSIFMPNTIKTINRFYNSHENYYYSISVWAGDNLKFYIEPETNMNNWDSYWNARGKNGANKASYETKSRQWFRTNCEN